MSNWREEGQAVTHHNNPEGFDKDAFEKEKAKSLAKRSQADFFRKEFGDGKSFGHRDVMPYHPFKDSKEWKKAKGTDVMGKLKGIFSKKTGGKRRTLKGGKRKTLKGGKRRSNRKH